MERMRDGGGDARKNMPNGGKKEQNLPLSFAIKCPQNANYNLQNREIMRKINMMIFVIDQDDFGILNAINVVPETTRFWEVPRRIHHCQPRSPTKSCWREEITGMNFR